MKRLAHGIAILLCLPLIAQAAYKCKQPDGTLSYQDTPCAPGAVGAKTALQPVQSVSSPSDGIAARHSQVQPQGQSKANDKAPVGRYQKEMQAQIDEMQARNKAQRCDYERQQLDVAKAQRPVFTRDNSGDRHYIDDDKRADLLAQHQQRVADACN